MSNQTKRPTGPTKKHLARMERERRFTRLIVTGAIVTLAVAVLALGYGLLDRFVLQNSKAVAKVNGEKITVSQFTAFARFNRYQIIQQAIQTANFIQQLGGSQEIVNMFGSQLAQMQAQLDASTTGQATIDQLVEVALVRQEAAKRGLTASQEEIDKLLQENFGYFPNGTPTPEATLEMLPTSTLSPEQLALVTITPTPTNTPPPTATPTLTGTLVLTPTATFTPTPVITATATATATPEPTLTSTPFTEEGYKEQVAQLYENFNTEAQFSEENLRYLIESQILRQKLEDDVLEELGVTSNKVPMVWLRQVVLADAAAAQSIADRLKAGEDFGALVSEASIDQGTKPVGGDMGWKSADDLPSEVSSVVFGMKIGQISDPIATLSGQTIIQVLGSEVRTLETSEYNSLRQQKFSDWLATLRESATIETYDNVWGPVSPTEPALPAELVGLIQQIQQMQNNPGVTEP